MIAQNLSQRQQLKILPQQIQLLNIFHLTTLELDQQIQFELEDNPVLEESNKDNDSDGETEDSSSDVAEWDDLMYDDIPDYKLEYGNYLSPESIPERPIAEEPSFREVLKEQLRLEISDDRKFLLGNYLIDSLNDSGLLDMLLDEVGDHISLREKMAIDVNELEQILFVIQKLEPAGVGARCIRECYLLQLDRMDQEDRFVRIAKQLLVDHYPELINSELEQIRSSMGISETDLKSTLATLATLQLRPLSNSSNREFMKETIIPDFVLTVDDGEFQVSLCNERSASIGVNKGWIEKLQSCKEKKDRTGLHYIKKKLEAAEWFVAAIRQRENTMLKIMKAILALQSQFFVTGDRMELKPMILKDIADLVEMDISTVSRITCNKYVSTPFGHVLLKSLFSEGLTDMSGKKVSARVIQEALKQTIENENKRSPYTDYQLVNKLAQSGFKLARRTIAKYREMLKIPTAQVRAVWG